MVTRRTTPTADTAAPDPDAIIAYLSQPITELRAAFDGTGDPADAVVLLNTAISQLDATEVPYQVTAAHLESTWTSAAADAAIPAIRGTRAQIVDSSGQSGDFAALIDAAVGTNTTAAAALDSELEDFATQARQILTVSPNDRGVTQVIDLAREMYSNALSTVQGARAEYDTYSGKLGEKSYTTPTSSLGTGGGPSTGDPTLDSDITTSSSTDTIDPSDTTTSTSTDPVIAMQQALGTAAIEAATTVGTQLITSGAEVLTTLITEGAGVATHAIDTLGTEAGDTISAALTGNTTGNGTNTAPAATGGGTNPAPAPTGTPVINFGGSDKPAGPGTSNGSGTNSGGAPATAPKPDTAAPPGNADQKPAAPAGPGNTPAQPGVVPNNGAAPTTAVVPPTGGQTATGADGEHKPRTQSGMTSPAAIAGNADSAVIPVIGAVPS
ncbi:hypothetical protein ACIGO9_14955 [Nocardia asteroides]|uniref:hypothetical protein n=1 Tax=Nocardia asteroides TaxID=1824 RepID=UPI0037CA38C2